jgi:Protein kinase domain
MPEASLPTILRTGATLAGYRVDGLVGSGGMGIVYEATQLSLNRTVALKVLAPHLSNDSGFRDRFRREAQVQAALEHPHIVTVFESGESDEGLFIATRLIRGTDLKELVEQGLGAERALRILTQVASALDAAHAAGLVHRDVKPQNVLVDELDFAYLADFGLIKESREPGLTRTGEYLGSLDYVSPEQIRGEPVASASDLYAFAAVLYECLSGEVPFPRDTEAALLYAHLTEPPPRLTSRRAGLSPALDAVVERGLSKEPAARFASATELVDAAQVALDQTGGTTLDGVAPAAAGNGGPSARSGETVVDRALRRRAPVIAVDSERRVSRELVAAGVAAALLIALLGFLIGRLAHGEPETAPPGVAVGGPLALEFSTDDWRPADQGFPEIPALELAGPIALVSERGDGAALVAGLGRDARGPRLLPPEFITLLERQPRREAVRIGTLEGFRYRGLRHRQVPGELTVYAVPTTAGVATTACLAPRGGADALARCEAVATTLTLREGEQLPLGANQRYAAAMNTALAALEAQRVSGLRGLREARTPLAQARAAEGLAEAFRGTAAGLAGASPGPLEQGIHRSVATALSRAADGYVALAEAAREGRRNAYDLAAAKVARAEEALDVAVLALERLGYRVRRLQAAG